MIDTAQAEILAAATAPGVYEKGGGYGQKGVDFQRYWAISRIIELVDGDHPDFLILFESLQDIVEFDSPHAPARAKVYQLKMKDTGEWKWKDLTALPARSRKKKNSSELTVPKLFCESPIGKLAAAVAELGTIQSEGVFVSNLGCNADLEKGSIAGSVKICKFSELSAELRAQISPELSKLKKTISLDKLQFHRTELSLEDPDTHVAGKVNSFLLKEAPKHAGQCKSFSDSLFATLSARGRRTDPPQDFADLVSSRGYSKAEFMAAVEALRSIPDQQELVNSWLHRLNTDAMPVQEFTKLQVRLAQMFERRLRNGSEDQSSLRDAVRAWVQANPPEDAIVDFIRSGTTVLAPQFPASARDEIQALLVTEGIAQCLNQSKTAC